MPACLPPPLPPVSLDAAASTPRQHLASSRFIESPPPPQRLPSLCCQMLAPPSALFVRPPPSNTLTRVAFTTHTDIAFCCTLHLPTRHQREKTTRCLSLCSTPSPPSDAPFLNFSPLSPSYALCSCLPPVGSALCPPIDRRAPNPTHNPDDDDDAAPFPTTLSSPFARPPLFCSFCLRRFLLVCVGGSRHPPQGPRPPPFTLSLSDVHTSPRPGGSLCCCKFVC